MECGRRSSAGDHAGSGRVACQEAARQFNPVRADDQGVDRAPAIEAGAVYARLAREHHAGPRRCVVSGREPWRLVPFDAHAVADSVANRVTEPGAADRGQGGLEVLGRCDLRPEGFAQDLEDGDEIQVGKYKLTFLER